jgi:porin
MRAQLLSVRVACVASVLVLGAPAADTQPVADESDSGRSEAPAAGEPQPDEQSTAGAPSKRKRSPKFGGPSSVPGTVRRDKRVKPLLATYFDFKERLEKDRGLEYGIDYLPIYQGASESLAERHAADGVVRLYARWEAVNRGTKDNGALVGKLEYRHRLGTDISPQELGPEIGYAGLTTVPFGDIDWTLPNLYWEQHLAENRVSFVAGIVAVTDYVDTYALNDSWTQFFNQAFATNPTIPAPGQGLGAAVRGSIGRHLYLVAGIADSNGDPTDPGDSWNSFFDTGEYFTHLEFGWFSSYERRFTDNVHVTLWHADDLEQAQVSGGQGLAFSWNRLLRKKWVPFVRAGYADGGGALWERSLSAGLGYFPRGARDLLGVGLNWGRPSEDTLGSGLDDQYTLEVFYRWRPLRLLTISPDLQLLFDPALNPDEDLIAVLGVRVRLAL